MAFASKSDHVFGGGEFLPKFVKECEVKHANGAYTEVSLTLLLPPGMSLREALNMPSALEEVKQLEEKEPRLRAINLDL